MSGADRARALAGGLVTLALAASGAIAQSGPPAGPAAGPAGGVAPGVLPAHWLSQDSKCLEIPDWQVAEYNPTLFILRQSPCNDYEKPFIFLLFGRERALLLDTGSTNGNLAPALQRAVKQWLARTRRRSIPLIVVHTHEHGDHVAGDHEIQALNDAAMPVTFVPANVEATQRFYGIGQWPEEIGHVDLGGRVLDLIPVPGHSTASVALYDRQTGILFSGDTLYPGRLYVKDFAAYQASIERLVRFTADKPVAHILGNHIEQSAAPFADYPIGTIFQPNEHALALSRGTLLELRDGLTAMQAAPQRRYFRDFSIWPAQPDGHMGSAEELARVKAYIEEQKRALVDPPTNHKEAH